jgi:hypothetical protein
MRKLTGLGVACGSAGNDLILSIGRSVSVRPGQ